MDHEHNEPSEHVAALVDQLLPRREREALAAAFGEAIVPVLDRMLEAKAVELLARYREVWSRSSEKNAATLASLATNGCAPGMRRQRCLARVTADAMLVPALASVRAAAVMLARRLDHEGRSVVAVAMGCDPC